MGDRQSTNLDSFEQLTVWQKAQDLAVVIYKITKNFPKEEKFGLTNQIRRSISSVSANIAEGFGRRTKNDKINFYFIAYGSLLETKNFLYLSARLEYIDETTLRALISEVTKCQKLLNGLIRSTKQ